MIEFFAQVQSRKTTGCGWLRRHHMHVFFVVGAHLYRVFFLFCPDSRTQTESTEESSKLQSQVKSRCVIATQVSLVLAKTRIRNHWRGGRNAIPMAECLRSAIPMAECLEHISTWYKGVMCLREVSGTFD
jgi:hypothetical protein